jgi:hypothetical protein
MPDGTPSDDQVIEYLSRHPEFLAEHPELAQVLTPPARWTGDSVVDIQRFLVDRLREELDGLRTCTEEVIETSRSNMFIQGRTHTAVLMLLGADSTSELAQIVGQQLPPLLDVDAAALAVEPPPVPLPPDSPLCRLADGEIDRVFGAEREILLIPYWCGNGSLFGSASSSVRSAALARLVLTCRPYHGLLALGSRHEGSFNSGQATDLLHFLARVVEQCLQRLMARTH